MTWLATSLRRRAANTARQLSALLAGKNELADRVNFVYRQSLGRPADPEGLSAQIAALRNGMPFSRLIESLEASPEAAQRRRELNALSDGEFILEIYELFQRRAALPHEIENWRQFFERDRKTRSDMIDAFFRYYMKTRDAVAEDLAAPLIMGTARRMTRTAWDDRVQQLGVGQLVAQTANSGARQGFRHSGNYDVSAIASLYKGRQFLERFLNNITTQTIFDRSELIIVDADSPEGEEGVIVEYQKQYPNIIYKRMNYRIGIYDAWNVGIQMARGKYLTSTNIDDLRRKDSFELQARALDEHPSSDVVYQDFFYSCDPSLDFDAIAQIGFKSELPSINKLNLMAFNSPHNAPLWRRALHDDIGLFDTSFRSAGDWDFWLRCLSKGKEFHKINTPHVAYFLNPEGISTSKNTRGLDEGREVLLRYIRKLVSPYLLAPRESFADVLGFPDVADSTLPYYDVVQNLLKRIGDRRRTSADLSD